MDIFLCEKISVLLKLPLIVVSPSGDIIYESKEEVCPFINSRWIIGELIEVAKEKDIPVISRDTFKVCLGCIKANECFYIIGPMATEHLNRVERHKYYQQFQSSTEDEKTLTEMTERDIVNTIIFCAKLFTQAEYTEQELLNANGLEPDFTDELKNAKEDFEITSEEEDIYRHTYQDERALLDMVRQGNVEEALNRTRKMDGDIGKLSQNDIVHWRNLMVVSTTLCARAAIDGGVAPFVAYRLSGFYINKGSSCDDVFKIITYRNQAVEELTRLVYEHKNKRHISSYIEQCKDYVKKHYKEKIYLDVIASSLGISDSYLSRLFKKEMGIRLQDYIVQVRLERAANLLVYSNETIPRIAEYVNFPSQSYFGKVFKDKFGMTPRSYRESNKPSEFLDN
ncbi:MAG: helix-turn-helix transcriptional regulator [Pseudobutyrivibrio sp.]|nr:helix-turn-helix transcriptional regulator [Pseudobutyrivibrio sp.]